MDRISIKNIDFSERLSEETNAFVADVYLDGKKFGYAKNSGHGEMTDIRPYPEKRDLYKEAVEYADSLGELNFNGFTAKSSLDLLVDTLLGQYLEAKEINRISKKGLVYRDKQGSIQLVQWKMPFKKVLEHPQGNGVIKAKILEVRSKGGKILNTNLPEDFLK